MSVVSKVAPEPVGLVDVLAQCVPANEEEHHAGIEQKERVAHFID